MRRALSCGILVLALGTGPFAGMAAAATFPAPGPRAQAAAARIPGAARPEARATVRFVMLPPRNLSGHDAAPQDLGTRLRLSLGARGAEFVPAEDVDRLLRVHRVRYTDSLSAAELAYLGERTGASHTLIATIFDCVPGSEPRLSFSLRAMDNHSGRRVLSTAVTLRGVDFEGLLGLGRIEDLEFLAEVAVGQVLLKFDARGMPRACAHRGPEQGTVLAPQGGRAFARAEFDPRELGRIALLPFDNRSGHTEANAQLAELLGDAWFNAAGVQVVETAELRAALQARKVRSMQFVDRPQLSEISRGLGVRYFAMGSIDRWGDEVLVEDQRFPELEVSLQILDVESGRIVAGATIVRRGSDYQTLLGLGAVRDPAELARRAARELVAAFGG